MPKKPSSDRRLNREQQRNLDIEISFMEGLIRREPQYLEALRILGDDYTRRGRVREGLEVDVTLSRLAPQDPYVHYNLACSYSLAERCDQAVAALEQAVKLGYRDLSWLARDPDLKNVRQHPSFRRLKAQLKSLLSTSP